MENFSRRRMLQAIGAAGIGSGVSTGFVSGGSPALPSCDDGCPEGTNVLAKYNWEDDQFVFDDGQCDAFEFNLEPAEDFEEDGLKTNGEGEPFGVGFTSSLYYHHVLVKTGGPNGGTCYSLAGSAVMKDPEPKDGHYSGWIDIEEENEDEKHAITYIAFCAASCFQVDFVFGESIEDLGDDEEGGFYGKRKIVHVWGNSATGRLSGTQSTTKEYDGCTVTSQSIEADFDTGKAWVEFTVDEGNDCRLTLASYSAPCPIGFTKETGRLQFRHEFAPEAGSDGAFPTFEAGGGPYRLEVDIPVTAKNLSAICPDGKGNTV